MNDSTGIRPGEVTLLFASKADARLAAQRRCLHRCRVWIQRDDDWPFGNIEVMSLWCGANIGPRHVDWYYRGGGVWCFSELEDMVQFQMVWQ